MKRILVLFLVVCMFSVSSVSAHTFPKMCISGTENSNGYVVDCANHQALNSFTYAVGSLNSSYSSYVTNGASKWSGTVTINKAISSYTAQGHIHTYTDPDVSTVAAFYDYQSYSSGHLYDWKIKMNTSIMDGRTAAKNTTTLAHEFGHAIGLNDLQTFMSIPRLMYGYSDRTATGPTSDDISGAKEATTP